MENGDGDVCGSGCDCVSRGTMLRDSMRERWSEYMKGNFWVSVSGGIFENIIYVVRFDRFSISGIEN